jgi:signal recognition particle subunit SRP54
MTEVADVRDAATPAEILLIADAMTGQDAVNVAQSFNEKLSLTGIVLTRVDGDARGGAALSMKAVTGTPILLLGTGEKLEALEAFHPDRIASRILGMGDVVSLVEKASELVEQDEAERLMKKMESGKFDLDDFASQLGQLRKMGGLSGVMGMLPGVKKAQAQMAAANIDDKTVIHQQAIIGSMTVAERQKPDLIKASRKRRIAAGSGTSVQDVNKLLKQYQEMTRMMKKMKKLGKKGLMRSGMPGMLPPGMPPGPGMR